MSWDHPPRPSCGAATTEPDPDESRACGRGGAWGVSTPAARTRPVLSPGCCLPHTGIRPSSCSDLPAGLFQTPGAIPRDPSPWEDGPCPQPVALAHPAAVPPMWSSRLRADPEWGSAPWSWQGCLPPYPESLPLLQGHSLVAGTLQVPIAAPGVGAPGSVWPGPRRSWPRVAEESREAHISIRSEVGCGQGMASTGQTEARWLDSPASGRRLPLAWLCLLHVASRLLQEYWRLFLGQLRAPRPVGVLFLDLRDQRLHTCSWPGGHLLCGQRPAVPGVCASRGPFPGL